MKSLISHLLVGLHHSRYRTGAAIALYLLILALGSIPGARQEIGMLAPGLVLHALAYGTIAFLLFDFDAAAPLRRGGAVLLVVAAMGAGDELLQALLPYRVGSWADWLVDVSAAILVLSACLRKMRRPGLPGKPCSGTPATDSRRGNNGSRKTTWN